MSDQILKNTLYQLDEIDTNETNTNETNTNETNTNETNTNETNTNEIVDTFSIPLHVYQTWHTKNLPEKMNQRWQELKKRNPEFEFHLFDDNECQKFIKDNFSANVLNSYNSLIPGAYKADLWRCCILFVHGGIYMDIKLLTINNFKLIELASNEHFVSDRPLNSIYNALMVCKPGNLLLKNTICMIIHHTKIKYYGSTPLDPTGPMLMGKLANKEKNINVDLKHYVHGGFLLHKGNFVVSTEYPGYDLERSQTYNKLKTDRYHILWDKRQIYKSNYTNTQSHIQLRQKARLQLRQKARLQLRAKSRLQLRAKSRLQLRAKSRLQLRPKARIFKKFSKLKF